MTAEGTAAIVTATAGAAAAMWTVLRSARRDSQLRRNSAGQSVLDGFQKLVDQQQEDLTRLRADLERERAERLRAETAYQDRIRSLEIELAGLRRAIGDR